MHVLSYLVGLLFCVQSWAAAQDEVFLDCSVGDYYRDLLALGVSPESWDPEDLAILIQETHRDSLPYTSSAEDVWDALIDLDSDDGMVRLIYRQILVDASIFGTPDTWNREHLWPRSRGLEESGPDNTDIHAIRPADWNVNSARNNLFFGDCEETCTRRPADEEAAEDTARNSDMFLPPASVRGDIARALFYMERRYSSFDETNTEVLELTDCPSAEGSAYQMAYLSDLLRWHQQDPPDDAERKRNERVCSRWQGNRNPFIDFPELVTSTYGSPQSKPYDCSGSSSHVEPTASPSETERVENTESHENPPSRPKTCSQLSPGDIQVVSMSTDNPDSVVLLALVDLPEGVDIFMTDNGWTKTGFTTNEGTLKIAIQTGIIQGSTFGFGEDVSVHLSDSWESVGSAPFALAASGDSIIVYCLDESTGAYHHLGGLISGEWADDSSILEISTNDSFLPDELLDVGAIEIPGGWDNLLYEGPASGTRSTILAALADATNWVGSNTEQFIYEGGNFEIDDDGGFSVVPGITLHLLFCLATSLALVL